MIDKGGVYTSFSSGKDVNLFAITGSNEIRVGENPAYPFWVAQPTGCFR
jgi:hypothetical protein